MKQGNTSSSNINSIFSQILERTDDHTVSVLFSDCIYSVQKGNALEYLNHQKNQTQRAFMDAIGKHGGDLALVMLQCKSVFNGFYFDMLDQPLKYYGFRPYFVVIMGETARVRDFCNRIELDEDHVNGLLHKYMVSSQNGKYKVSETDKKFDNFLRNVNRINIGTFFHICSQYGINWKEERQW